MAKPRPQINQPIHPIELAGGKKGVLLFHGFTATPDCLKYLAHSLNKAKFTVFAPVLEGHGTHEEHLAKTSWRDWYRTAENAYIELTRHCEQIFVAGLSMGGLIALHLAYHHRSIPALSLLATPIFLEGWLVRYLFPLIWKTPLRRLFPFQRKYIISINDPTERRRHQTYEKVPVSSVANLFELQKMVRRDLRHIHQP